MQRCSVNHAYRLEKQLETSVFEYREYGVKKLRSKSYSEPLSILRWWDNPSRTIERNWKKHRKTQFKALRSSGKDTYLSSR